MKNLKNITLLLLVFCVSVLANAQAENENFYLNDDKLTWQKSYVTDKSKDEVYNYFVESELFDKAKVEGNVLVGKLAPHLVDEKKVGVPGVPEIIRKNDFIADVSIEYRAKEKDYVVSLTNLNFLGRGDNLKKKEKQPFEEQFVRVGYNKYRPGFLKKPKEVYNFTITPIFKMD